jgi:hypothetical protein
MPDVLSEDELKQMETRRIEKVEDTIPPPTPAVVARAQEIRDGVGAETVVFDESTKVAFLAHVLEGATFKLKYDALNGSMSVYFKILTAAAVEQVARQCRIDESDNPVIYRRDNREQRSRLYSMCLAITELSFSHRVLEEPEFSCGTGMSFREEINHFLEVIPATIYEVIKSKYLEFVTLVDRLLKEGETESFWVTPS